MHWKEGHWSWPVLQLWSLMRTKLIRIVCKIFAGLICEIHTKWMDTYAEGSLKPLPATSFKGELCSPWSSLCINAKSPSMPYSLPSYRYLPMDENRKRETSEKSHLSKIFGATIAAYSVVVPATAGASLTSFAMQLLCLVRTKKKTWKTDRNRQVVRHMIYT